MNSLRATPVYAKHRRSSGSAQELTANSGYFLTALTSPYPSLWLSSGCRGVENPTEFMLRCTMRSVLASMSEHSYSGVPEPDEGCSRQGAPRLGNLFRFERAMARSRPAASLPLESWSHFKDPVGRLKECHVGKVHARAGTAALIKQQCGTTCRRARHSRAVDARRLRGRQMASAIGPMRSLDKANEDYSRLPFQSAHDQWGGSG